MENEENQTNTYSPLELDGRRTTDSPESDHIPPRDANLCVYVGLVMASIGFVLPYNSFIIASDFWQTRFPGRSVALDMSMTYIIVAFATVLLNNIFLSLFSFKVRIQFGYMISISTFLFVSIREVAIEVFSAQTAYSANLAAVSLTAIGCTVQQSSFYGFASMFPKQYTQAVMTGESLAGFVVASTRILTKLFITNDRVSTFFFFLMSVCYIAASYTFHSITIHSPFVRYHTKQCAKIVLRPDEDAVCQNSDNNPKTISDNELIFCLYVECDAAATRYGVLSLDSNSSPQVTSPPTGLSFSNPVYELSNPSAGESTLDGINNLQDALTRPQDVPNVAYKVEHIITPGTTGRFGNFRSGLESRWRVAHSIYPYMVSIALAYCVTLSLYPGIETEIISCNLKTWMPVLLMFTFNISDLIGKMIAITPYNWTRRQLILLSGMRTVLIPLLLLCCAPRSRPVIAGETPAFIFSAALGVTNGLASSLPMMLAPSKVPVTLKEVTGNMMTLTYNVGLTAGLLIGYVFESMLGPQLINPCPSYPYIPLHPATTNASMAFTSTTTSTTTTTPIPAHSTMYVPKKHEPTTTVAGMTTAGVAFVVAASTASLPEHTTRFVGTAIYNATEYVLNSSAMISGL